MARKIKIEYNVGHGNPDKDGIISEIITRFITVEKTYIKIYDDPKKTIANLNGLELNLFFYLTSICGFNNIVGTTQKQTNDFINQLHPDKKRTNGHIKSLIHKLKKAEILIETTRGSSLINPILFWKDSDERNRRSAISKMMEEKVKKRNQKLKKIIDNSDDDLTF